MLHVLALPYAGCCVGAWHAYIILKEELASLQVSHGLVIGNPTLTLKQRDP